MDPASPCYGGGSAFMVEIRAVSARFSMTVFDVSTHEEGELGYDLLLSRRAVESSLQNATDGFYYPLFPVIYGILPHEAHFCQYLASSELKRNAVAPYWVSSPPSGLQPQNPQWILT